MAELTLKTLPDPSKIDDKKTYTLRGVHVRTIVELLYQLWRGENIGNSSSVKKNSNGDSGFNFTVNPQQTAIIANAVRSTRPFFTTDASAGGTTPFISVTAGTVTDLTNSAEVWTGLSGNIIYMNDPVDGNVPFALQLVGPPVRQPKLQISTSATCSYLNATIDSSTGFITAMEIDADSGGGLPSSTMSNWYQLLSTLSVSIDPMSGVASVNLANDGAQSSLYFKSCGLLPLTDGNGYTVGT